MAVMFVADVTVHDGIIVLLMHVGIIVLLIWLWLREMQKAFKESDEWLKPEYRRLKKLEEEENEKGTAS